MESIDLTGSTLDIENDHISDKTRKKYESTLVKLKIYLFDNDKELLLFKTTLRVANIEDEGNQEKSIACRMFKAIERDELFKKMSPITIVDKKN